MWLPGLLTLLLQEPPTINALLARGAPTFVVGTLGDERCDRAVAAQARLIRGVLFPSSEIVPDVSVDAARRESWPANLVLYGGAHVNTLVDALAAELPFTIASEHLEIGGLAFEGAEYRLIAAVPAADGSGAHAHPAFLLYAGAGTPGVEEINGVSHGPEGFLVIDRFGVLVRGTWERGADGPWRAVPGPRQRRIQWRRSEHEDARAAELAIWRPGMVAPAAREKDEDAALLSGLARAREALGMRAPGPLAVYVSPDRGSKRSLTGNAGDGHADFASGSVHVIACDPAPGGSLERLAAHEFTHLVAARGAGTAGSSLLGEGLAVWASGSYAGKTLVEWRGALPATLPNFEELSVGGFARHPESTTYPLAGLWVRALIETVGREPFLTHLYGAPLDEWNTACERAGSDARKLMELWERIARP